MKYFKWLVVFTLISSLDPPGRAQGFLDALGLGRRSTNQSALASKGFDSTLSQDQIVSGLKEALAKGVQNAVNHLGHENGFLTNLNVRIPMPEKLLTVEKTLRALNQDQLADQFITTMNHAAEQAVPEAARVFAEAVQKMSIADAISLLTGPTNAATQYFRKTSEQTLYQSFLPIIKKATDQTGVSAAYKNLMEKANANSTLGSLGRLLLGNEAMDLDAYVTTKALDGLFKMIEEEEKRIRENPVARTSELLQKVFGAVVK